jgi:hypothetical protein
MGRTQALYRCSKDGNDSPRKEMSEGERAVSATQGCCGRKAIIRIYPNRIKCDPTFPPRSYLRTGVAALSKYKP